MTGRTADPRDIAIRVLRLSRPLTKVEQRLLREGQRALVNGEPLAIDELGRLADVSPLETRSTLSRLPGFALFDDVGRIVGLLGLSLQCSAFRFEAAGRIVSTWCAWDSLFIPRVIGMKARVASHCPKTQKLIQLVVGPDGVISTSRTDVWISFLVGGETHERPNVVGACCRHIHFLSSSLVADLWLSENPEGFVLTLDEAWKVGRVFVDEVLFASVGTSSDAKREA